MRQTLIYNLIKTKPLFMESAEKDTNQQSMLLQSSKVLQVPSSITKSFYNEYSQRISTKAQLSCDLHKHLTKLQLQHQRLSVEANRATHRAMRFLNETLQDRLAQLNVDNCELREQYKEIVQSKNLRRRDRPVPMSSKVSRDNSQERITEELYEIINRESLVSNKSAARFNPRMTMPRVGEQNRRESFRTTRNNCKGETLSSIKKPFMSGKVSLNNSFYLKKEEPTVTSENIFLSMMNIILEEEKIIENKLLEQCAQFPAHISPDQMIEYETIEKMLKHSYARIEGILEAIEVYKENITKVGTEIEGIQTIVKEFVDAKTRISEITSKVKKLPYYKQAIQQAQSGPKPPKKPFKAQDIESIKMFLQLFAEDSQGQPILTRIKKIESDKLLVDKRQSKIKQLIDSIRQGRRKFEQICEIYMQRISLLQNKIQQHLPL